jgi:hypothetical protein
MYLLPVLLRQMLLGAHVSCAALTDLVDCQGWQRWLQGMRSFFVSADDSQSCSMLARAFQAPTLLLFVVFRPRQSKSTAFIVASILAAKLHAHQSVHTAM